VVAGIQSLTRKAEINISVTVTALFTQVLSVVWNTKPKYL
jgi:hypothetical protein